MTKHAFARSFLFALTCLLYHTTQAQYYFDKLTEEHGLSDNRVTSLLKDKTGFLWIGTRNGLNRYDGNTFSVFRPNAGNCISNEEITDIVQDTSGRIWVSTLNGLNSYNPKTNHWETLKPTGGRDGIPNYIIWDLHADEKNRLWIVSDVWQLSVYDPATKKIRYFDDWPAIHQQPPFDSFPRYRSIQKITDRNEQEYWLGTTIGLFSVNKQSGKLRFYGAGFSGTVKDLQYDRTTQSAFLVTEHGQLFCYDEKANRYAEIKITNQAYPATHWNKADPGSNTLHLAHPLGMLAVNKISKEAIVIRHQPTLSSTLLPGGANAIYTDKEGIVWAGTNNGICYYNSHNKAASFIPLAITSDKAGIDNMSAACYDEVNNQYFVTALDTPALFVINANNGHISTIRSIDGKPLSSCTNILRDRQGTIWLLTETTVYRYDRAKDRFVVFPTPNKNEPVIFHDILEDKQGNYWLATWQGGMYFYQPKTQTFRHYTIQEGVSWANTTSLLNDPADSALWIGSFTVGVSRYDLATHQKIIYAETDSVPEYMQLTLVRDMIPGAAGRIWIATYGAGLYYYQPNRPYHQTLTQITAKEGLTSSSYYALASNGLNRLWLLKSKGISVLDSSGRFLYEVPRHPAMSFSNYVPDVRYPKRISYNNTNNELLVPVSGGLLLLYPDHSLPPASFPVVLTNLSVEGRTVTYDSSFYGAGNIEIPYRHNTLSFQFAALHYRPGRVIQYEYKLHEHEAAWRPAGTSSNLHFSDLSAGHYTFMLRARDATGTYSSNTLIYRFRIIPPFWQTGWFISLVALAAAYGFYAWTLYLRRKLKAQQILNYFATSLYGQNTVEDICWDVAKNCISKLQFVDCMVYIYDPRRKVLVQKAANGPKSPAKHEIINPLEIPLGKGIVGAVAQSRQAAIIPDTSKDHRYIVDDERRYSEITVPVLVDGQVFGIIDSEHPRRHYYKKHHLKLLQEIAAICANKISKYIIEERLRSKISRDLHDEIGSALTSINVLSKVALKKSPTDTEVNGYLHKIQDSTYSTMESMSDIVWAINPKNDKLEALSSRMKEFAADICEAQGIALTFQLPAELEQLPIDLANRKNLFLVFKEAVNNAVKHSHCTALHIELTKVNNRLRMTLRDNGVGFTKTTVLPGNGLNNIETRVAECNGTLRIETGPQQGTTVELEIPLPFLGETTET
ncbi:two-component regulator propeller domain-containing protein [Paraflavitalea sp. CAU 1676]|uniref:two-component regulator propeller domain-containing protein n=1 Tax=Paraflavitalea sp. CAU 1676 TaxID=3032598 RepID=UPI0023DBD7B5|nr:two-component regulator propeller domain-containing protein [Paraflavitalea sp. CAU 1676]MDF2190339.1 two-component regulator propeller domain-containing protein [Paraflavitalea sp. CAU 1676]